MGAQICAVLIFLAMFVLVVSERIERQYVTLGCGAAVFILVFGVFMHSMRAVQTVLNLSEIFQVDFWFHSSSVVEESSGINWATIFFITGMMIMVESMGESGFFRWLCMSIAKAVNYRIKPIFITFMIMSAILAMFIDSITVILFLSVVTVELARLLSFNPVPMVLTEIFCANLGGSATMCGDPPNIIIGTSLGFSFFDFIENTGVIALVSLVAMLFFFYFSFRSELKESEKKSTMDNENMPNPASTIKNKPKFVISCVIFGLAVVLLVTHSITGLTVATIGVFIAIFTLLSEGSKALYIAKKVDYKTILFFIGLFIVVGGLEETGVLQVIAEWISKVSGGNSYIMIAIILLVSAFASAFVDNIPFAATMVPIIKTLAATSGMDLSVLAWTLSMGTDIGGCATPIGASANVVGISVIAREGHPIGWAKYCRTAVPATLIVLLISLAVIFIRYVVYGIG